MTAETSPVQWTDLYLTLGKLVVAWGQLEVTVRNFVVSMMPVAGPNWHRPQLLVDGLSAAQMEGRCARLAWHVLGGTLRDDTLAWLKEIETLRGKRNEIIHSDWASAANTAQGDVGPAGTTWRVKKPATGLVLTTTAWRPEAIDALTGQTSHLVLRGYELQAELQPFIIAESRDHQDVVPWTRSTDAEAEESQQH